MQQSKGDMLDAPIPGQSLTGELGSKPWERAPRLNTVEEVIEDYLPMFEDEDFVTEILNQIESGIPIIPLVNILIKSGVMGGDHSIDTGLTAAPVLVELLISAAEASDVTYDIGNETKGDVKPSMSAIALALKDFKDDGDEAPVMEAMEISMMEEPPMEEPPMEEPSMEESMGLMAKRGNEDGL